MRMDEGVLHHHKKSHPLVLPFCYYFSIIPTYILSLLLFCLCPYIYQLEQLVTSLEQELQAVDTTLLQLHADQVQNAYAHANTTADTDHTPPPRTFTLIKIREVENNVLTQLCRPHPLSA